MLGKKSKEEKIPEVSGEIKNNEYSEAYNFDNNYSSSDNKSREDAFTDEILENYGIVNTAPEPEKKTRKTRRGKKSKEEIITDEPREDFENQSAVSEPEKKTRKERRSKKSKEESAEESSGFDVFASSSETESDKDKKKKKSSKKKAAKDKPENSKKRSQEGDLREEDDRDTTLSGKGSGRFSLFNKKQKGRNKKSEDEEYEEGGEEEYYTSIPEYDYREVGPLVFPKHDPVDTILESYWIEPGLSRISIVRTQDYENVYITHEPALTDFEKYLLERLHSGVRDLLIIKEIRVEDKIKTLYEAIDILIEGYKLDTEIEPETIYKIRYYLKRSFFGWGRIDPLKGDTEIEDISCDGYDSHVFIYHRKYRDMRTLIKFKEPRELDSLVALFAQKSGKHISLANPIVDATLPEGSRIQLTYGTVVGSHGSSFTIRKFRKNPFSPIDLIINGTFTVDQIVYMWMAVEHNHSVLIIGGTASGKTTTLNAMAQFIPALSKVVTIEDTREINLDHENWIASIVPPSSSSLEESKHDITMFDLLKAAMRQRPEYILVGEVRGVETQTLFQAMNTGHTTFSTLHAGDVVAAINRLQNHPLDVPKATIETLDVVISQARMFRNGKQVRRCNEIVEIVGLTETGDLEINQVYTYDPDSDKPYFSGFSDVYATIAKKTNRNKADFDEEINVRKTIISSMVRQEIHDYRDVARIVWLYLSRRDFVIENIDNLKPLLKKGEAMFKTEVSSSKGDSENSSVETYYEQLVDEGKASDEEATSSVSVEMHIIDETSSEP
ncbi:MAG: type II/IV secretion system ATPase subunit, partial [Methanocorpusculum sp.]|nr:type II/IV secretion system ATPase subunit [Methanocorpusculum sp.]